MRLGRSQKRRLTLAAGAVAVTVGAVALMVALRDPARSPYPPRPTKPGTSLRGPATKLLGGPLLFRFAGRQPGKVGNVVIPKWSYIVILRLSRDPKPHLNSDAHDLPPGVLSSRGNYTLAKTITFSGQGGFATLGRARATTHCFFGVIPAGRIPVLDRVPVGGQVSFAFQALTPQINGSSRLGKRHVTHPVMLTTDIGLTRNGARRRLARIGCGPAVAQQFDR
jgi:hypothetical protein